MINCSHVLAKGTHEHDSGRYLFIVSFGAWAPAGGGGKGSAPQQNIMKHRKFV